MSDPSLVGSGAPFSLTPGSSGTLVAVGCYRADDFYQEFPETPLLITLDVSVLATPEPTTALLMASGLLGLAWQGRRRRA